MVGHELGIPITQWSMLSGLLDNHSVQLQILILSNGTTIPVSAEEGVRLLTDPTIQAALVPLGFSIVHVQAGKSQSTTLLKLSHTSNVPV